jgi:hypothetical protein
MLAAVSNSGAWCEVFATSLLAGLSEITMLQAYLASWTATPLHRKRRDGAVKLMHDARLSRCPRVYRRWRMKKGQREQLQFFHPLILNFGVPQEI